MNSDEFFITKILLDGSHKNKDFEFTISVDDIPPTLTPEPLPSDLIDTGEERKFEKGMLIGGLIFTAIGAGIAGLIFCHWESISCLWHSDFWEALKKNWLLVVSTLFSALPALLFLVVGPMLCLGSFTNFSFPKKRKFPVPSDYAQRPFHFRHLAADEILEEKAEDG